MVHVRVPAANYIVVGDSTAHRFDGVIIEQPGGPIVFKARWQPVSRIRDVFTDGKISEYLTRILMEMRHVKRTADTHWPFPSVQENVGGGGPAFNYEPRNADKCVLLFSCGECDLLDLAHEYAAAGHFDQRAALAAMTQRSQPLFDAIRTLKSIGYDNVFLHGITPPTKAQVPWGAYEMRLQLALMGRELFERFAQEADVGLVPLWDEIFSAEEGRDSRYARDHLHLNGQAAVLSAQKLYALLEQRGFYEATTGAAHEYPNNSMSWAY